MSSSEPADAQKKPPEKPKAGDPTQTVGVDHPSKEVKQKGEKRKAEPGTVLTRAEEMKVIFLKNRSSTVVFCFFFARRMVQY